jgi:hypothetical protein
MNLSRTIAISSTIAFAALATAYPALAHRAVKGCQAEAGKQIAVTPSYRYTLLVGPPENMFMPRQVRVNRLKHGEVMLRGSMTTGGMLTGGPIRHVEVQICSKPANAVVTNASPKIVIVDESLKGKTTTLPVAVMEDISKGTADLHYGNNLAMPAKHRFLITVTWNGERASFRYVSPRG